MKPWRYEPAEHLDLSLLERLKRFPREPSWLADGVRALAAVIVRVWLRVYHRIEVRGREHLPSNGSFVMVANHTSHLDALCLSAALPLHKVHRTFPVAAMDYFFTSLPRAIIAAMVANALPFTRRMHVRKSLELCTRVLQAPGSVLILFPEGTRSLNGEVAAFRPGIGALLAGRPIVAVPCWLTGAHTALPKGSWLPRPRKVRLLIGAPRSYACWSPSRFADEHIAAELRAAVLELELEQAAR